MVVGETPRLTSKSSEERLVWIGLWESLGLTVYVLEKGVHVEELLPELKWEIIEAEPLPGGLLL